MFRLLAIATLLACLIAPSSAAARSDFTPIETKAFILQDLSWTSLDEGSGLIFSNLYRTSEFPTNRRIDEDWVAKWLGEDFTDIRERKPEGDVQIFTADYWTLDLGEHKAFYLFTQTNRYTVSTIVLDDGLRDGIDTSSKAAAKGTISKPLHPAWVEIPAEAFED